VLKPDSKTPFTALLLVELLREAGLPHDVLQIVTGPGAVLGTPLIQNVDYLMFTGSSATGRKIAAQCGEQLIGCSAELGGKNPLLVLGDADPEKAAAGAVRACFANTGQLCMSVERVFVQQQLLDDFCAAFVAKTQALRMSASNGWDTDLGPLIDKTQFDKVSAAVDDAVAKGATVLTGGRPRPDLGPLFYEPTILADVTPDMQVHSQEVFGPVVWVQPFATDAQGIGLANDSEYGLNASVWTGNPAHGRAVGSQIRCGTVNINDGYAAAYASIDTPMGGMGISGLGRRHGPEGLLKYTDAQSVAVQRVLPLIAPAGVPRQPLADALSVAAELLHAPVQAALAKLRG
jgi:succinate-semialdehyde dehydrogenase/glutarate-semialdehyde dehydrogenase